MMKCGKTAFTIIELMVVIMIASILVGLLFPAVQSAREVARGLACINNLRQIGIASHQYNDLFGSLPPGRIQLYDQRQSIRNDNCGNAYIDKSCLTHFLPFIELKNLYNAINHDLGIFSIQNVTVHTASLKQYQCPSDKLVTESPFLCDFGLDRIPVSSALGSKVRFARSSYCGLIGPLPVNGFRSPMNTCKVPASVQAQSLGAFRDVYSVSFQQMSKGLSETLIFTERRFRDIAEFERIIPGNSSLYGWMIAGNWGDTLISSISPINPSRLLSLGAGCRMFAMSASSEHPGGVNALFADGSVRFINQNIESWQVDTVSGWPSDANQLPDSTWENLPEMKIWQKITLIK